MPTSFAFIGFGEAAQLMSSGLSEEPGAGAVAAYDIRLEDPAAAAVLHERAAACHVRLAESARAAIEGADIVLSTVPGKVAVAVARSVAGLVGKDQLYVDLNSTSPVSKRQVADAFGAQSDCCVDGAILDAVQPHRHRVPILLAGPRAGICAEKMNAAGMRCEALGDVVGQASSVKMIRSVFIKGVEALILESMGAAEKAGVTGRIHASLDGTFGTLDWRKLTSHYLRRTHEHGPRRQSEMSQAAETLEALGMSDALALAIGSTIGRSHARLARRPYDAKAGFEVLLPVLAGTEADG